MNSNNLFPDYLLVALSALISKWFGFIRDGHELSDTLEIDVKTDLDSHSQMNGLSAAIHSFIHTLKLLDIFKNCLGYLF